MPLEKPQRAPARAATLQGARSRSNGAGGAGRAGPGLRKTALPKLLLPRQVELWGALDYQVRELLEQADVMSEGATRNEGGSCTYYGITSILLLPRSQGGGLPDDRQSLVVDLLRGNPHVRTRAIRMACREAQVRSQYPLVKVQAELRVFATAKGVQVDIEVEARVDMGSALPGKRQAVGAA